MTRLFILCGTPGAGKTTVLSGIRGIKAITVGTEMLKEYSRKFGVKDRDDMRKLGVLNSRLDAKIRSAVLKRAAHGKGTVVLDTHAALKTKDGYYPGFSLQDLDSLKKVAKALIYIDASDEEILGRRTTDKTRKRENDTQLDVDQHRTINLSLMSLYSLNLGVPLFVVMNKHGRLEETRGRLHQIMNSVK